jgi:hypothetical protein
MKEDSGRNLAVLTSDGVKAFPSGVDRRLNPRIVNTFQIWNILNQNSTTFYNHVTGSMFLFPFAI